MTKILLLSLTIFIFLNNQLRGAIQQMNINLKYIRWYQTQAEMFAEKSIILNTKTFIPC